MPNSEAQKRATAKYKSKTYDRIELRLPKGDRDTIRDYASYRGKSVNTLIIEILQTKIPGLRH